MIDRGMNKKEKHNRPQRLQCNGRMTLGPQIHTNTYVFQPYLNILNIHYKQFGNVPHNTEVPVLNCHVVNVFNTKHLT
jgi:hypothetical protein